MKCEHAQDFFSDYIEQSLDKPAVVALEAHLTRCTACQKGLEGLRQTWGALHAVPAVEPPKDLAWRVISELQRERLEQLEAERKRTHPFVAWLHSLTPGVAFGYAVLLAILFVGLAFPLVGGPDVTLGWPNGRAGSVETLPPAASRPPSIDPLVTVGTARQDAQTLSWYYPVVITPQRDLRGSTLTVQPVVMVDGQWRRMTAVRRTLEPETPVMVPMPLTTQGLRVEGIYVRIEAPGMRPFEQTLDAPTFGSRVGL